MSTAHTVLLSVGDGATSDYLTLSDGVRYKVREPGIAWPTPDETAAERQLTIPISVYGTSADALIANRRAIELKLRQAQRARGPHGIGSGVTLGVQLHDATSMLYFDVKQGGLKIDTLNVANGWLQATLYLTCEPDARGSDITVTNALTYTDDASNAAWVKTSVTVTSNSTAGPDGSTTADTLTPGAANSSMYQQVSGLTAGVAHVFSVWLQSLTGSSFSMELGLYTSGGVLIGSAQTVTVTTAMQRFSVSANIGANTTVRCQLGGSSSWATGENVAFWGAQLEPGSAPGAIYLRIAGAQAPTNGDQGWFLYGIPGDAPAPIRLTVTDQSTGGKALNGLRFGARSGDDLKIGDYTPVVGFTAGADGTSGADAAAYGGTSISRTLNSGGGTNWRELAYAALSDKPYNRGRFEVDARLVDTVGAQDAPTGGVVTVVNGDDVATQTPSIGRSGQNNGTSVTTITVNLGGTSTAGSTLIAFMYCDGNGTQAASAASWTSESLKTFTAADGGTNVIQLLRRYNAPAVSSVAFTVSSLASPTRITVIEVQNVVAANAIIQARYSASLADPAATFEGISSPNQLALGVFGAEVTTASAGLWSNQFTEGGDTGGTAWVYKLITDEGDDDSTIGMSSGGAIQWAGFWITLAAGVTAGTADAGNLDAGSLSAKVAAVDYSGTISAPLTLPSATIGSNGSKATWGWTAPVNGGTSHYLLVVNDGTTFYEYLSDTVSYVVSDLADGAVVSSYPAANGTSFASWRVASSTTAQTERYPASIVKRNTVNGQAELIALGVLDVPPSGRFDDGTEPVGALYVQTTWAGARSNTVKGDVAWLFPDRNTASLMYTATPRTTLYKWIYESRRDGTRVGAIQTMAGADAGTVKPDGSWVTVGPGNAHLVIAGTEGSNLPNMVDLKFSVGLVVKPRYRDLIGAVS